MIQIKNKSIYDTDKSIKIFSNKNSDSGRYIENIFYVTRKGNFFQIQKQVVISNGCEHIYCIPLSEEDLIKFLEFYKINDKEIYKKAGINLNEV